MKRKCKTSLKLLALKIEENCCYLEMHMQWILKPVVIKSLDDDIQSYRNRYSWKWSYRAYLAKNYPMSPNCINHYVVMIAPNIFRWSVVYDRSPIVFVKIIFLSLFIYSLLGGLSSSTGHLLFSSEFSFLLGGLSSSTDHLLISSEFSLLFLLFIRWSVNDRSPIDFVRIFFLSLFIRWAVYRTDHLIISLELPLFIYWSGGLYIIQTTLFFC